VTSIDIEPSSGEILLHVVVVGHATGEPAVLLIEREPRVVEFPVLTLSEDELLDEERLIARVAVETGLDVLIEGFLEPGPENGTVSPQSRFLVVRSLGGTPSLAGTTVGWEWRPAAGLVGLQFIPT